MLAAEMDSLLAPVKALRCRLEDALPAGSWQGKAAAAAVLAGLFGGGAWYLGRRHRIAGDLGPVDCINGDAVERQLRDQFPLGDAAMSAAAPLSSPHPFLNGSGSTVHVGVFPACSYPRSSVLCWFQVCGWGLHGGA